MEKEKNEKVRTQQHTLHCVAGKPNSPTTCKSNRDGWGGLRDREMRRERGNKTQVNPIQQQQRGKGKNRDTGESNMRKSRDGNTQVNQSER